MKMVRVVASLTTLPHRYATLVRTLRSLRSQTYALDEIYLGIPEISARLNQPYPPLPAEITNLCTVVTLERDYGPVCKILGALISESDPECIIITVDDDIVYPANFVQAFVEKSQAHPNAAVGSTGILVGQNALHYSSVSALSRMWDGFTGFDVPREGRDVDVLCGVSGIAYRRRFFPLVCEMSSTHGYNTCQELVNYALENSDVFHNDDVLLSTYIKKYGAQPRVFLDLPFSKQHQSQDAHSLSHSRIKFLQSFHRAVNALRAQGLLSQPAAHTMWDSWPIRVFAGLLFIFILVLSVWFMVASLNKT